MSVIVDIDFEGGDLTEFNGGTVTDGGDLSVTAGAALAGTDYGLSCLMDDANGIYGYYDPANEDTGKMRLRFYLDPNSIPMSSGNEIILISNIAVSSSEFVTIYMDYSSGYRIKVRIANDSGYVSTSAYTITDEPHYVEGYITKATTSSSNDGTFTLWIDGTQKEAITNLDNNTVFNGLDWGYFGASPSVVLSGTIFLDQLVINNDGSEIGPLAVPSSSVSPSLSPSASLSPSSSESPSLSPSSSESPSLSPSASSSPSGAPPIEGSVCWGHVTGVVEQNTRTFATNWSGTGTIENSGDTERLVLGAGEYMESEVVNTGAKSMEILLNNYLSGDTVTLKFRMGSTVEDCTGSLYSGYSGAFNSMGFVQIRVESTL